VLAVGAIFSLALAFIYISCLAVPRHPERGAKDLLPRYVILINSYPVRQFFL
jgi:hypothetical protein